MDKETLARVEVSRRRTPEATDERATPQEPGKETAKPIPGSGLAPDGRGASERRAGGVACGLKSVQQLDTFARTERSCGVFDETIQLASEHG